MCLRFRAVTCLIAGGWVGVMEYVFDGAEHPDR